MKSIAVRVSLRLCFAEPHGIRVNVKKRLYVYREGLQNGSTWACRFSFEVASFLQILLRILNGFSPSLEPLTAVRCRFWRLLCRRLRREILGYRRFTSKLFLRKSLVQFLALLPCFFKKFYNFDRNLQPNDFWLHLLRVYARIYPFFTKWALLNGFSALNPFGARVKVENPLSKAHKF